VINSGDISFDGPTSRSDLEFAKELHDALPVPCRLLPGNHDVGDNPTAIGPRAKAAGDREGARNYLSVIGEDRGVSTRPAGVLSG
jgi:3',5'-cyclic AMP phosphodiesterase CpdA